MNKIIIDEMEENKEISYVHADVVDEEKLSRQIIDDMTQKLKKQHEDYLYLAADFDNYRKNMNNKINHIIKNANKDMIINMLEIIDDMERSLRYDDNFPHIVYDKFVNLLSTHYGLKRIKTQYLDKFDVSFHEAIGTVDVTDPEKDNTIQEVVLPGYMLNDDVIRYAKVIVFKYNENDDEKDTIQDMERDT